MTTTTKSAQFIECFLYRIFRNAQNAFYKVLLANAATSALRLHQRMPRLEFTREYFALLLVEDSCHYLFFSTIFLYVSPFILILLPVVLFAILHAASYSLTLLDVSWNFYCESFFWPTKIHFYRNIFRHLAKIRGGALVWWFPWSNFKQQISCDWPLCPKFYWCHLLLSLYSCEYNSVPKFTLHKEKQWSFDIDLE